MASSPNFGSLLDGRKIQREKRGLMTTKELENKVKEIFTDADSVGVTLYKDEVRIEIAAMYEVPGRDLPKLIKLSEILGTTDINEGRTFDMEGCDTCDYGSNYGVELVAPNIDNRITYESV